jgi:hypothetical protein
VLPNSMMNPISEATNNVPPDKKSITTPPINASSGLTIASSNVRMEFNAM